MKLLDKLEEIRIRNEWSQTDLASHLSVSGNYIYRLRAGDRKPGIDFLSTVINVFPEIKPLVVEYIESTGQKVNN